MVFVGVPILLLHVPLHAVMTIQCVVPGNTGDARQLAHFGPDGWAIDKKPEPLRCSCLLLRVATFVLRRRPLLAAWAAIQIRASSAYPDSRSKWPPPTSAWSPGNHTWRRFWWLALFDDSIKSKSDATRVAPWHAVR